MDFETYAVCKPLGRTIPGKTVTINAYAADDISTWVPKEGRLNLVAGQTYTLSIPTATELSAIECKCVDMSSGAGLAFALGNIALFDPNEGEDTGEPYLVAEGNSDEGWAYYAISQLGTHPLTITTSETVEPIDPKYLPVIEMTTEYPNESGVSVALTAEESEQLNVAAKIGNPIALRLSVAVGEMNLRVSCVCNYFEASGGSGFEGSALGKSFIFLTDGYGGWVAGD